MVNKRVRQIDGQSDYDAKALATLYKSGAIYVAVDMREIVKYVEENFVNLKMFCES